MKLLNSTVYKDKEMTLADIKSLVPLEKIGISEGYYGGRVKKAASTKYEGVYLLMDKYKVIDILVDKDEPESLYNYTNEQLKDMLIEKGIDVPYRATKEILVDLLVSNTED